MNKIEKDVFVQYYIIENHSLDETASNFNVSKSTVKNLIRKYDCHKDEKTRLDRVKKTNLEKYGTECVLSNKDIRTKIEETNLKKYGVKNVHQSNDVINRTKETNQKKYGGNAPICNADIMNKVKQTNLEKYGFENAHKSQQVKDKFIKTMNEKYGVDYAMQSKELLLKRKQTNIKKYGTDELTSSNYFINKATQTMLEKYGVMRPMQNNILREKIIQTNLKRYGVQYAVLSYDILKKGNYSDSRPNKEFEKLLQENAIPYEKEINISNYRYDFKVENTLIEINPSATHNSTFGIFNKAGLDPSYHINKSDTAKNSGYACINIFDWDDKNKVINLLKPNKTTIYARKCKVKEISSSDANDFLCKYHLQGSCNGNKYNYGLFYNDELVEVMTFGKPRYNKNYEYELLRLSIKPEYKIVGGSQKIFKHFISNNNIKSIISYCDKSKFSGDVYDRLGFKLLRKGKPSKHWYSLKAKKHITDNLLRQKGFDLLFGATYGKGTSNEELMKESGWVEIYDCGQDSYVWTKAE